MGAEDAQVEDGGFMMPASVCKGTMGHSRAYACPSCDYEALGALRARQRAGATAPQRAQDGAGGLGGPKALPEYPARCTTHHGPCACGQFAWDAERRQRDAREAELLGRATGAEAEAMQWRDLFGGAQARWCAEQARAARAEATARDLYALVDERTALLEACAAERAALAARVAALEGALEAARPVLVTAAGFMDWIDGGIRERLTSEALGYVRAFREGFAEWEVRGAHPLGSGYVDAVGTALSRLEARVAAAGGGER